MGGRGLRYCQCVFVLSPRAPSVAAGVVGIALLEDEDGLLLGPGAAGLADELGADLLELFTEAGASAQAGEATRLVLPGLILLGIGVGDVGPDAMRAAGAGLARAAVGVKSITS